MASALILNTGKNGHFSRSGELHSSPEQVDNWRASWEEKGVNHIAIYLHGGLVSESSGRAAALMMHERVFEPAGVEGISIVWETGVIETIRDELHRIHQSKLFQKLTTLLVKKLSKRIGLELAGVKGRSREPSEEQILEELEKDRPFESLDDQLHAARSKGANSGPMDYHQYQLELLLRQELEQEMLKPNQRADLKTALDESLADEEIATLLKQENISEKAASGQKGILSLASAISSLAQVGWQIYKRFKGGRDHGFYPTLVEEILRKYYFADIGAWAWKGMKVKAENMWLPNDQLPLEELHGGTYLLDTLTGYAATNKNLKISLIGHSAGCISICELINAVRLRNIKIQIENIIFLAPAVNLSLFKQTVLAHSDQIQRFRMFTMSDDFEVKDAMLNKAYPRSLLYMVSGIFENAAEADLPILGMERHIGATAPIQDEVWKLVHPFLFRDDGEAILALAESKDGVPDGYHTKAIKHGMFDDDPITQESIKHILEG